MAEPTKKDLEEKIKALEAENLKLKESAPAVKKSDTGMIESKGGVYIAERECTFGIGRYDKGAKLKTHKGQKIPYHFIPKKEYEAKLEAEEDGLEDNE